MEKVRALARHLCNRPSLPTHPQYPDHSVTDVDSGIEFPLFYCALIGCTHIPTSEKALYQYIHRVHYDILLIAVGVNDPKNGDEFDWIKCFTLQLLDISNEVAYQTRNIHRSTYRRQRF